MVRCTGRSVRARVAPWSARTSGSRQAEAGWVDAARPTSLLDTSSSTPLSGRSRSAQRHPALSRQIPLSIDFRPPPRSIPPTTPPISGTCPAPSRLVPPESHGNPTGIPFSDRLRRPAPSTGWDRKTRGSTLWFPLHARPQSSSRGLRWRDGKMRGRDKPLACGDGHCALAAFPLPLKAVRRDHGTAGRHGRERHGGCAY